MHPKTASRSFTLLIITVISNIIINNKRPLTPKSMPPAGDEHAKLKT